MFMAVDPGTERLSGIIQVNGPDEESFDVLP
jgi:hypothetical protein